MIKFHKVSLEQWIKDCKVVKYDKNGKEDIIPLREGADKEVYDEIKLPKRATVGSAGYDIYSPFNFELEPGESIKIPLGIRAQMDNKRDSFFGLGQNEDYSPNIVLMIFPRSGLGFKYKFKLWNDVGIIDKDYFYSDNEGHIHAKFKNEGFLPLEIKRGDAICQGIFMNYLTTDDDNADGIRNGGFGSTSR